MKSKTTILFRKALRHDAAIRFGSDKVKFHDAKLSVINSMGSFDLWKKFMKLYKQSTLYFAVISHQIDRSDARKYKNRPASISDVIRFELNFIGVNKRFNVD